MKVAQFTSSPRLDVADNCIVDNHVIKLVHCSLKSTESITCKGMHN